MYINIQYILYTNVEVTHSGDIPKKHTNINIFMRIKVLQKKEKER